MAKFLDVADGLQADRLAVGSHGEISSLDSAKVPQKQAQTLTAR